MTLTPDALHPNSMPRFKVCLVRGKMQAVRFQSVKLLEIVLHLVIRWKSGIWITRLLFFVFWRGDNVLAL